MGPLSEGAEQGEQVVCGPFKTLLISPDVKATHNMGLNYRSYITQWDVVLHARALGHSPPMVMSVEMLSPGHSSFIWAKP